MKLVDKFTLWFIGVTLLLTPITTYFCYYNIEKRIDEAEIARLKEINEITANQLRDGISPVTSMHESPTTVTVLASALPKESVEIQKISTHDTNLKHQESRLVVNSFFSIKNTNYEISSYNYIPGSRQILDAILGTVIWKLLLIILCVGITARLVSQRILHTLRQTMKKIQGFNVKQKVQFPQTGTQEFKELNSFLQKMTDKAVDEYASVKEFSENASHELQTPLAVLRNKLELLSETNIEENQAALISDMQNAIEKLSKINRSLTLLAKLENNEYAVSENIKFCRVAKDVLAAYEDRIEMKNLSVKTDFAKNILLKIHPTLADMLMNNLVGNAIRHNVQDGSIELVLTQKKLVVKNTGLPPEMPVEELFQRFKKGNQCSESVGLGLSIVKQICEVSGFFISYHYSNQLHVLQIDFQSKSQEEVQTIALDNLAPAIY
ncbi:signal transduction histidine kinase [Chitinophaga niastensis]|uniref:histidine kinase n=1 Tax=Chitinophaga niastensis TaxID=536980 RepID=A0A2P8HJC1_CHINA|nr:HAMP domain-containing sensor histidine kinase [Chitinophaga niastensis]PSL46314.1 signal transduction histidine kinase [Chitinophaga niastensis]